jgi:hypothetical protein
VRRPRTFQDAQQVAEFSDKHILAMVLCSNGSGCAGSLGLRGWGWGWDKVEWDSAFRITRIVMSPGETLEYDEGKHFPVRCRLVWGRGFTVGLMMFMMMYDVQQSSPVPHVDALQQQ